MYATDNQTFTLTTSHTGVGQAVIGYSAKTGQTHVSLYTNSDNTADGYILIDGDHRDFANFLL